MSTKLIAQKIYEDVKIKRFKSEVRIERTGNIEVSEKITCVFKRSSDNPVLVRKMGYRYKNLHPKQEYNSSYQIKSLKIDKQPMVYESVSRGDSVFFNFGKGTNKISPGTYEFEFKYVIVNQISCNENQDYCELTWDVNGFNSGYAIDQLICIVSAEENNVLSYPRSYSGSMVPNSFGYGLEGGKYCTIQTNKENVVFKSIKKYKHNEGERIVVLLPKDYFFPDVINFAIERDELKNQQTLDRAHRQYNRDYNGLPKGKVSKKQADSNDVKRASEKDQEPVINSYDWHLKKIKERIKEEKQLVQEEENNANQDEMIGLWERDSTKTVSFTVIGILLIGLYYYFVWRRYGRDPPEDTVYPVYYPPQNLQPSAMGYILDYHDMTTDRYFTGEVLNLVCKNAIRIEKRKNHRASIVFVKNKFTELTPSDYELTPSEEELLKTLFPTGNELVICPENRGIIGEAKRTVLRHCGSQNENNRLFTTNDKWLLTGWLISVIYFIIGWLVCFENIEFYVPLVLVVLAVIVRFIVPTMSRNKLFRLYVYGLVFIFLTFFCLYLFATYASGVYFLLWLFLLGINYRSPGFLKAPTALGQQYMTDIKGFKMYLSTVGDFKNSTFNSFQLGQNELDSYLPYAHALGVKINWVEEFEDQFNYELNPKN